MSHGTDNFHVISICGAVNNCAAVIDGYLLQITAPTDAEVGNVKSYFFGHYQAHINIQDACDGQCRFVCVGIAGPGIMPEWNAVDEISLGQMIKNCLWNMLLLMMPCIYKQRGFMI